MENLPENEPDEAPHPPNQDLGFPPEFQSLLESQRQAIHSQLHELQRVVLLQCQITGTNPLAEEMVGAVLGRKTGKTSGELSTPKALTFLYNFFSIKDTITKKEARELSALSGATVTQVREFFSVQRSRVRKVVNLAHGNESGESSKLSSQLTHIDLPNDDVPDCEDSELLPTKPLDSQHSYSTLLNILQGKNLVTSVNPTAAEKADYLVNFMRKEKSFLRQSELAQLITQIDASVLRSFIAKGGLQQIIKWLMQAAIEEQTSLIRILLKTVSQLPLGYALPRQMSLLLQTINKLRFYRAQDVASRARMLLSRWSKFIKGPQNGKIALPPGLPKSSQQENKSMRESLNRLNGASTLEKKSKVVSMVNSEQQANSVSSSSLTVDKSANPIEDNKNEPDSNTQTKKRIGSIRLQGERLKQKRKVQIFEDTWASARRKDADTVKASSVESAPPRPLSADDIKKAKMRAFLLRNASTQKPPIQRQHHQKSLAANDTSKTINTTEESSLHAKATELLPKTNLPSQSIEPQIGVAGSFTETPVNTESTSDESMLRTEDPFSILESKQTDKNNKEFPEFGVICWKPPPRFIIDSCWRVAAGEQSSEVHSQTVRLRNELEPVYLSLDSIPHNPEEPVERVCLFVDDSLVPEILIEAVDEECQEKESSLASPQKCEVARSADRESVNDKLNGLMSLTSSSIVNSTEDNVDLCLSNLSKENKQGLPSHMFGGSNSNMLDNSNRTTVSITDLTLVTALDQTPEMNNGLLKHSPKHFNQAGDPQTNRDLMLSELDATGLSSMNALYNEPLHVAGPSSSSSTPVCKSSDTGSDNLNLDLSQLSQEKCIDMLKVVLQQLTEDGKGFGADLELLSVFLKNPDLVHVLMSIQAGAFGKGSEGSSCTLRDLSLQVSKLIGGSMPSDVDINKLSSQTSVNSFGSNIRPLLSSTPPPFPQSQPIIEQPIQHQRNQSPVLETVHQMHISRQSENSSARHWSHQQDYQYIQQVSGLVKPPAVNQQPSRPVMESIISAPTAQPIVATQIHNADRRIPASVYMPPNHADHRVLQMSMKNGFPLTDLPNTGFAQNLQNRDNAMSAGFLQMPHPNHRVLPPNMSTDSRIRHAGNLPMPSPEVGGTFLPHIGNHVPPHPVHGHHYRDQNFRLPLPTTTTLPLHPPVPHGRPPTSFVPNSYRPQWRPSPAQLNRGRQRG